MRLHDIRLNGPVLEYIGRGKSLVDVGLAQAKTAICTRNHYFEIEVRVSLLPSVSFNDSKILRGI